MLFWREGKILIAYPAFLILYEGVFSPIDLEIMVIYSEQRLIHNEKHDEFNMA